MIVIARKNDTVDGLCWRHLGMTEGVVEETLNLNKNLSELGMFLPAGTKVKLPMSKVEKTTKKAVKLWD